MIWSRTSSSPVEICVTSTFLRHAFLPFLLDCLYCAGAASVVAMVRDSVVDFQFVDPRKSKSSEYSKNVLARAPILGKGRGRSLAANGSYPVSTQAPKRIQLLVLLFTPLHIRTDNSPSTFFRNIKLIRFSSPLGISVTFTTHNGAVRLFESAEEVQVSMRRGRHVPEQR